EAGIHVEDRSAMDTEETHDLHVVHQGAVPPVWPVVLRQRGIALQAGVYRRTVEHTEHIARVAHEVTVGIQPNKVVVVELFDEVPEETKLEKIELFVEFLDLATKRALDWAITPHME